jgi:penicillin amidase
VSHPRAGGLRRWVPRVLGTLALLLALAVLGATWALRASLPRLDGALAGTGLEAGASIERDASGVATITAASRIDAAFALGFAHASDRYFQMDLARRMAAGRLAELVGDAALPTDRRQRLHRFESVADRVLAGLPPEQRAVLDAYAAGASAGLAALRVRPFEYLLLRQRPQPWSARDSLLVVYAMYLQLNDAEAAADRQRGLLKRTLPAERFAYVYSAAPRWEAPLDGQVAPAAPAPGDFVLGALRERSVRLSSAPTLPRESRVLGSNNWAIAGSRTASGGALLADDMHLGLSIPNTWYRARLRIGAGTDLVGATLPGVPTLVVGSNGRIAWGFTNSYGDYADLVLVERSPDGRSYRSGAGWRPLQRVSETLRSASGKRETLELEVTEWGPLLPDDFDGQPVALRWTAHEPHATNLNWLLLEGAASAQQALALAPTIGGPVQNLLVADRDGHIGWTPIGRIPRRGAGYDPTVPSAWNRPDAGWQGWLDPADYPRAYDPPDGQLWTANNRVVGGAALGRIGDGAPDRGARAQQIRDRLQGLVRATERDMLAIQLDDRALFLTPLRNALLDVLDGAALVEVPTRAAYRRHLLDWGARAAADSVGYRLVRATNDELERRLFDALTVEARQRYADARFRVPRQFHLPIAELIERRGWRAPAPDHVAWRALLLASVDATIAELDPECADDLADCRWGERNAVTIRHPLSRFLPALARWLDMPRVPMSGDSDLPHVHGPGFGASQRMAVSPGREAAGLFHMPGGQSGHPLSPFYAAGHEDWVGGRPSPLLPGAPVHELRLLPARH